MSTQAETNYTDDAQRRVASDTLAYTKKATLVVPTGSSVALPADAIRLLGCYQGAVQLQAATPDTLLMQLSAGDTVEGVSVVGVLGRTLHLLPTPSEDVTLTIIYAARTPAWDSEEDLALSGPWETLTDQLVQATTRLDGGETTMAADALAFYDQQAAFLRRRAGAKPGQPGRVRTTRKRAQRL